MRLSKKKSIIVGIFALISSFAVFQVFSIYDSARQMLAETRARQDGKHRVAVEKKILTPHLTNQIEILQNTDDVRAFVKYENSFFAATGGGLVQYDEEGKRVKHFTVLDGLPESDLTALAVFEDKLFIGTRAKNLVAFDGSKFENYIFTDRKIQSITALTEDNGKLLIGTFDGGLIEFDGTDFTEIKADDKKLKAINCLSKAGEKLFVGTFDNGLWIRENGIWKQFTKSENLPSNRVVGIVETGGQIYAATDLGLAFFDGERFQKLFDLPNISSLSFFDDQLFIAKANGEIFTFDKILKSFSNENNLQNAHLISAVNQLWLASNNGIFSVKNGKIKQFGEREKDAPTDNFISAITFDTRGNLWLGTFRSGIDVFSADGKKLKHIEDETTREINFLQANKKEMSAATSAGLVNFKPDFTAENLTRNEGLPSNSVTHFAENFIATTKGLAFSENGKFRIISAVNNLPNNAVYATLKTKQKLYAGTLGGLAEIENGRVTRTFKDSNSGLKTNWVTALVETNERIFIGTYGGGIFELSPSGEIRSFESDAGKFVVNPNALFLDGKYLFAGTLDGVKILDLQSQKWKTVRRYLPSETVMSIASDDDETIYFATTNGLAKFKKNYFTDEEAE
ncbi:MAG: two-component regulator propeller domain-containing protein [Pyrinomonadaceae bacterium]